MPTDQLRRPEGHEPEQLARESLQGLAVGDALGASREGSSRVLAAVALAPGGEVLRWTDDTEMAISVVEVLLRHGALDQDALAAAFARRYTGWRGYGGGMHRLLGQLRRGGSWRELAPSLFDAGSFGNGSAMRIPPLGAFFGREPTEKVAKEAVASAEVTHSHREGKAGAVAVALAAWLAARSRGDLAPRRELAFETVVEALAPQSEVRAGVERAAQIVPATPLEAVVTAIGNGSNVTCQDTVPLVLWIAFAHFDDFEGGVRTAIRAGGDTDTVAAMVGGILAARLGVGAIPGRWLQAVEPLPPL